MSSLKRVSYWQAFRLMFTVFALYLLGDAFYRWDGFRYYASFSEFLPSLALAHVVWSILAAFATFGIWLLYRAFEGIHILTKSKVRVDQSLLFAASFGLLGGIIWISKKYFINIETSLAIKLLVLFSVFFFALLINWLSRNKSVKWMEQAGHWMNTVQERITPLVWIFGVLFILSALIVSHKVWINQTEVRLTGNFEKPLTADKDLPNILLVTFDGLSARDMSVYGYHGETTPFMSKWAKRATLFMRTYAEGNYTAPTTASLMTGKRIWTHQRQHPHGNPPLKSKTESLPLLLKNKGYYNMAFNANFIASVEELGIADSFDFAPPSAEFASINSFLGAIDISLDRLFGHTIKLNDWVIKEDFLLYKIVNAIQPILDQLSRSSMTEWAAENVFNKFLAVLDNRPQQPFFAWIHLLPPHAPYLPPEPYMGIINPSPKLRTATSQAKILDDFLQVNKIRSEFELPKYIEPELYDIFRDRYDEFILYCDKQLEDFYSELSRRNIFKNTVIIVSADHGDIFRPPFLTHGNSLYDPELHIPLIIQGPDQTGGIVVNDLVEQIDIPATILDFADINIPSWMEGRSLVPYLNGGSLRSKPAISMDLKYNQFGHEITKASISIWEGDYKLIYFQDNRESLLFNLKNDPGELNNLINKETVVGQRLLDLINKNLEEANERISRQKNRD